MIRSFVALAICSALMFAAWTSRVAAADADCPAGDEWVACAAEHGDRAAMYAIGRRTYDEARTSGDFTEALKWSRKLAATKEKNGDRLLKMVYLQLGWGVHRDYPQAYTWLSEAIASGDDYLVPWRKMLIEKMTPEQLVEAKKQAGN